MFPWNMHQEMKKKMQNLNPHEIDQYVQEMLSKMLPKQMEDMLKPEDWLKATQGLSNESSQQNMTSNNKLEAMIFETHDFVFIRIPIKEQKWLQTIKIYHTSSQATIENIPETGCKTTLTLPAAVKKKGGAASLQDGILELRLPRSNNVQVSEIDVPEG